MYSFVQWLVFGNLKWHYRTEPSDWPIFLKPIPFPSNIPFPFRANPRGTDTPHKWRDGYTLTVVGTTPLCLQPRDNQPIRAKTKSLHWILASRWLSREGNKGNCTALDLFQICENVSRRRDCLEQLPNDHSYIVRSNMSFNRWIPCNYLYEVFHPLIVPIGQLWILNCSNFHHQSDLTFNLLYLK